MMVGMSISMMVICMAVVSIGSSILTGVMSRVGIVVMMRRVVMRYCHTSKGEHNKL